LITKTLMTCPGMGVVRVAELVATVVTPHRFRTRASFWSYCGLSVVTRSSSDWQQNDRREWEYQRHAVTRGLTRQGNRRLKRVFFGAALTAITRAPEVRADYEEKLKRTRPPMVRITIARKLAAVILAMRKAEEVYDPNRYTRHA